MNTKSITHTALSLALFSIFFLLFKGVSNILNSILIPIVLYLNINSIIIARQLDEDKRNLTVKSESFDLRFDKNT